MKLKTIQVDTVRVASCEFVWNQFRRRGEWRKSRTSDEMVDKGRECENTNASERRREKGNKAGKRFRFESSQVPSEWV